MRSKLQNCLEYRLEQIKKENSESIENIFLVNFFIIIIICYGVSWFSQVFRENSL